MKESKDKVPNIFSRFKLKKSFVGLFFAILSALSYQILYLSLLFVVLAIIYGIMGLFEKQYLGIIVIILSIASVFVYFLFYQPKYIDPNNKENILIGSWKYNDKGGVYKFNKDNTYYQYILEDQTDNYCTGKYRYSFGYDNAYGITTTDDHDYYYYKIDLKASKCIFDGKEDRDIEKYDKTMLFGYNKFDHINQSIIINTTSEKIFLLTKEENN